MRHAHLDGNGTVCLGGGWVHTKKWASEVGGGGVLRSCSQHLYGMLCKRKCQRFRPPIQRAHRFPIDPRGHLQEVEEVLGWQTVFH